MSVVSKLLSPDYTAKLYEYYKARPHLAELWSKAKELEAAGLLSSAISVYNEFYAGTYDFYEEHRSYFTKCRISKNFDKVGICHCIFLTPEEDTEDWSVKDVRDAVAAYPERTPRDITYSKKLYPPNGEPFSSEALATTREIRVAPAWEKSNASTIVEE